MKPIIFKVLIPLAIVAGGILAFYALKNARTGARPTGPPQQVAAVETIRVKRESVSFHVTASGIVRAAQEVHITPEVTGTVTWVSPNLIPGGHFKKGDVIARIDKRNYQLAIEQQQGQVKQAELNLQLEQSRTEVAEREWTLITGDTPPPDSNRLALRKPHLKEAAQRTESARSGLKRARLDLSKTTLTAPFDAMVVKKNVDKGQLVGPSAPVATLMGTDELWIELSVPQGRLGALDIPEFNAQNGSLVNIRQQLGTQKTAIRQGRIVRLVGQLDSQNRTATVLVSIPDPFSTSDSDPLTDPQDRLPLLAGAYVDASIEGQIMDDVVRIPRKALRGDNHVWTVKDDKLVKTTITVVWREPHNLIVSDGLNDGDELVVSSLAVALEGMPVERIDTQSSAVFTSTRTTDTVGDNVR